MHKPPNRAEVAACRAWLESELAVVQPRVLVALGATAAATLLGPKFRLTHERGQVIATPFCEQTLATYHPSALLRSLKYAGADEKRQAVIADLKLAAELADGA